MCIENDDCAVGSYEQYCNDYAVFGDPMRDHYDYEEAAAFDRCDGYREDVDNPRYDDCSVCGDRGDCADCIDWKERADRAYREAQAGRADCNEEVPF